MNHLTVPSPTRIWLILLNRMPKIWSNLQIRLVPNVCAEPVDFTGRWPRWKQSGKVPAWHLIEYASGHDGALGSTTRFILLKYLAFIYWFSLRSSDLYTVRFTYSYGWERCSQVLYVGTNEIEWMNTFLSYRSFCHIKLLMYLRRKA